jgi:hypothetical protein
MSLYMNRVLSVLDVASAGDTQLMLEFTICLGKVNTLLCLDPIQEAIVGCTNELIGISM